MKITIIGSGYVGLVSGACLAELGHLVTCVDSNINKISELLDGKSPIYEPGLDDLLKRGLKKKTLLFKTSLSDAVPNAEVIFIAVGTPTSRRGSGYADMSFVYEASRSLASHLRGSAVVVIKSTVPVGSARQISSIIKETNPSANFSMASNPEFLREGEAIYDFMHPDRIVIGADSEESYEILKQVYQPLDLNNTSFVFTNLETAELIKYASNAFLATKISFINEMANLCEAVKADVTDLARGMGLDSRIGPKFLHPGPGYGGSCFPKDTMALMRTAQEHDAPSRIIETVVEVNNSQKTRMVRKIREAIGSNGRGKILAVLGLTFKPETDDMRESPSLTILPALMEKGLKIKAHDPAGMEEAKKELPEIQYCSDPYLACDGADAVCLMTEWNPYRTLDLKRIQKILKQPLFIDLRNVYLPKAMKDLGFIYVSIGRPLSKEVN